MAHLDEQKLLSDKQHAFRKWHSCETQLATMINDWAKILDNKGQVDTFILDFEKAFDPPPPPPHHMNPFRVNCLVVEFRGWSCEPNNHLNVCTTSVTEGEVGPVKLV